MRRVSVARAENVQSDQIKGETDGGNHHHLPAAGGEALDGLGRTAAEIENENKNRSSKNYFQINLEEAEVKHR